MIKPPKDVTQEATTLHGFHSYDFCRESVVDHNSAGESVTTVKGGQITVAVLKGKNKAYFKSMAEGRATTIRLEAGPIELYIKGIAIQATPHPWNGDLALLTILTTAPIYTRAKLEIVH